MSNNKNVVKGPENPTLVKEEVVVEPVLEYAHEEAIPIPEPVQEPAPPYMYQARVKVLLNLREKPTKSSNVLRLLQSGEVIEVLAELNGWAQLEEGYCMLEFIDKI